MNRYKQLLWATAACAALVAPAHAELKIGFVNTARVLEQAPQAKAARERLQQEFSPRESDIVSVQRKLKDMQERLERDGPTLSDSERVKLERELLSQQRELKRAQGEFSEDLNLRRNEEFSRLQREAAEAIVNIAREDKFDLVLEAGVVFASEKVDVTEKVLTRLRDVYGKQQSGKAGGKK
ncbi:MAG: OmpH family outer membrane protein [Thiohalomonadaceae bacterium]